MEDATFLRYDLVSNGLGGLTGGYVDGAPFRAAFATVSTADVEIAYAQGVKTIVHITTRLDMALKEGDRVRRERTGTVYRVTSNAQDRTAPDVASASIAQRVVTAEVVTV